MGLPPLAGTHNTLDELAPLRQTVVTVAKQATAVAQADVKPFEERLQSKADDLARGALYRVTADLLTQALHVAIDAAFERVGTEPVGMDPDGRLIVATPWSKRSHAVYGLRRHQADLLRQIVVSWQAAHERGQFKVAPVFMRDSISGKWYVNLTYTDVQAAHKAVGRWITPQYVRKVELSLKQSRGATGAQTGQSRTTGKAQV